MRDVVAGEGKRADGVVAVSERCLVRRQILEDENTIEGCRTKDEDLVQQQRPLVYIPQEGDSHDSEGQAESSGDEHEDGDLDDFALLRIVDQGSEDDECQTDGKADDGVQAPDDRHRWRRPGQEATGTATRTPIGQLFRPVRHLEESGATKMFGQWTRIFHVWRRWLFGEV